MLSASHPQFLVNTESNPALYNRCSIQWLGNWNEEAMSAVGPVELRNAIEDDEEKAMIIVSRAKQAACELCSQYTFQENLKDIHSIVSDRIPSSATPRHFVTALKTLAHLINENR